jgi:hypothetical protein
MHDSPPHLHPHKPSRSHRAARWARTHHRTALAHLLKGLCYGTGTAAASLLAYLIQQHL